MRNIKGWHLEIIVQLFKKRISIAIHPLVWRLQFLATSKIGAGHGGPHLFLGCLHIWIMDTNVLIGLEIDIDHDPFWWDCLTVPETYRRVF